MQGQSTCARKKLLDRPRCPTGLAAACLDLWSGISRGTVCQFQAGPERPGRLTVRFLLVPWYPAKLEVGHVLQRADVASEECPLGSLTAAVLVAASQLPLNLLQSCALLLVQALVCNSDCGATNTHEVNLAETLWQRALKAGPELAISRTLLC